MGTVSHLAYINILPSRKEGIRPRIAIFTRKNTPYSYTARPNISNDSDILILQVSGPEISPFQLINIYNKKGLEENQKWTIKRNLESIKPNNMFRINPLIRKVQLRIEEYRRSSYISQI
jgi:hypothetical protein